MASMITPKIISEQVVAAFEVDRRMPRVAKPRAPGNAHLHVYRSRDEVAETVEARRKAGMVEEEICLPPTREEVEAMETAFGWLRDLASLGSRVETYVDKADGRRKRAIEVDQRNVDLEAALRAWAIRKAQPKQTKGKKSLRSIAASMGLMPMDITRRKDRALAIIVERLNAPTLH